jgi:hypothetical protein
VGLVGRSLGGVTVREVARELPDHGDGVVLFGSPIIGGPTHIIAARAFDPAEAYRPLGVERFQRGRCERRCRSPASSAPLRVHPSVKRDLSPAGRALRPLRCNRDLPNVEHVQRRR